MNLMGWPPLIRALARMAPGRRLRVRFIGDGASRAWCIELAKTLGVSQSCEFPGEVSHSRMLDELACAWFAVVPSRSEAFGLVTIESMAVGTPVVASAVGGIPEIVRDGLDGVTVAPDDPEALAHAMVQLLDNASLRDRMARSARQRFLDTFEQSRNVRREAEWLEAAVHSAGRPAHHAPGGRPTTRPR